MALARKSRTSDQYNLEARLETLIHEHLLDMEEHPNLYGAKDRLSTIQYVGMFLNRKYGWGEPETDSGVGSTVRKYSRAAFQTPPHVAGPRATGSRSASGARVGGGIAVVPADTSDPDSEDTAA